VTVGDIVHHLLIQTSLAIGEKVHKGRINTASASIEAVSLAIASFPAGNDEGANSS